METEFNFTKLLGKYELEVELIFFWDRLQKFVARDHPLCKSPIYLDAIIDKKKHASQRTALKRRLISSDRSDHEDIFLPHIIKVGRQIHFTANV